MALPSASLCSLPLEYCGLPMALLIASACFPLESFGEASSEEVKEQIHRLALHRIANADGGLKGVTNLVFYP